MFRGIQFICLLWLCGIYTKIVWYILASKSPWNFMDITTNSDVLKPVHPAIAEKAVYRTNKNMCAGWIRIVRVLCVGGWMDAHAGKYCPHPEHKLRVDHLTTASASAFRNPWFRFSSANNGECLAETEQVESLMCSVLEPCDVLRICYCWSGAYAILQSIVQPTHVLLHVLLRCE